MNYRAFRFPWRGRPQEPPRLVSHAASGRRALYASWNGATEVDRWRLEAGPRRDDLEPVLTKAKQGFETSLPVPAGGGFGVAVALDAKGRVLGRSNAPDCDGRSSSLRRPTGDDPRRRRTARVVSVS